MVTVYDDLMLQLGLVDENEYNYIQAQMQACGAYIEAGKYLQALKVSTCYHGNDTSTY